MRRAILTAVLCLMFAGPASAQTSQPSGAGAVPFVTAPSLASPSSSNGGNSGGGAPLIIGPNDTTIGTAPNTLTKITSASPSRAIISSAGDTGGTVGICVAGCTIFGNASIQTTGIVNCLFDNATTAGDYVQISPSVAGDCHDTGSSLTYPTVGEVIGRVFMTNGSAGQQNPIDLFPAEIRSGGGGSPGGSNLQIQYNNGGSLGGFTMNGDASINVGTGTITVSKINGVTPGGNCSGTTPFVAAVTSNATANCMSSVTTPTFGPVISGTNGTVGGSLTLMGATSGSVQINVPAAAGTGTLFQVPNSDGTNGQALVTDGSGHTSWSNVTGTGTVTSISCGTGLTCTPNPIIGAGSIAIVTPIGAPLGGLGVASPAAHSIIQAEGSSAVNLITAATAGRIIIDQGSGADWAAQPMSGDATLASNGAINVSKTGGVAFAASATTNALNASNISSGTIAAARLPAFTGDTTTSAGSTVTTTAHVNGVAYPASPSVHQVPVVTAANTITYKTIPDCQTAGGTQALNYTQSTDAFSCNAVSGGGGGGSVTTYGPTTIAGATSGSAYCSEVVIGLPIAQIDVQCVLVNYLNTTGTAQVYGAPFSQTFTYAAAFTANTVPPCSMATANQLGLPTLMTAAETGVCHMVGL